ncbi:hypothetical protein LA345_35185 [Burkholderia vietnamiensis]|nr:hypothetical protein [Burkholderia vietnamiensis]
MKPLFRFLSATSLVALCIALVGCEKSPFEKQPGETVAIAQVPAAVKATIDRQSQGGSVRKSRN